MFVCLTADHFYYLFGVLSRDGYSLNLSEESCLRAEMPHYGMQAW